MTTYDADPMDEDAPDQEKNFESAIPSLPKINVTKVVPNLQKRKFSFPASLHGNLLGINTLKVEDAPAFNTKRRFSNVSDVVSRKLSTTIGWRTPSIPPEEVIAQGRVLCGQYIRNRLKRSGIFSKKLGLYRIRSMVGTSSAGIVREVFPGLVFAGVELERMYPKLYTNVARQASATPGGVLISDKAAAALLSAIAHDLFKGDITWGKIVSIFAVTGGLAVDCVCQGHPEYLHALMDGMEEVMEDCLADWVATNGGWVGLSHQCRTEDEDISLAEGAAIVAKGVGGLLVAYLFVQFCWKILFSSEKSSTDHREL